MMVLWLVAPPFTTTNSSHSPRTCNLKHSPSISALPPTADPQIRSPTSAMRPSKDSCGRVQKKDERDEQAKLQERLERLEREITHKQASSDPKSSPGRLKEVAPLRIMKS